MLEILEDMNIQIRWAVTSASWASHERPGAVTFHTWNSVDDTKAGDCLDGALHMDVSSAMAGQKFQGIGALRRRTALLAHLYRKAYELLLPAYPNLDQLKFE